GRDRVVEEDHAERCRAGRADAGPHRVGGPDLKLTQRERQQPEAGQRRKREAHRRPEDPQAVTQLQAYSESGFKQSGGNKRHPCHLVTSRLVSPAVPPLWRAGAEAPCAGGAAQMETVSIASSRGTDRRCIPVGEPGSREQQEGKGKLQCKARCGRSIRSALRGIPSRASTTTKRRSGRSTGSPTTASRSRNSTLSDPSCS